ncbi:MAG: cytidylate kinase-like family protein [Holophaga sp.]|nr:cytidylate kinase-like family protein [Holophaga sp.]
MSLHPAITISRSLGCGGTDVGFRTARNLGWHFCDRRILRMAAEAVGQSVAGLAGQEERHCGFMEHMMNVLAFGSPEAPYTPLMDVPLYSRDLFQLQRKLMLKMVEHAPSVIVGRGGFVALKELPDTIHVSIDADPAFRAQSLVQRGKMPDLTTARRAVEVSDRDRAAFIRDISGLDWHDPRNFQLVLDVSRSGVEACVQRIVAEARRRFPLAS